MTDVEGSVELTIDELAAGGDGVGRDASGRVTFVAYTAPGDRIRARVTEKRKQFARAELVEVLEPSAARATAACQLFVERRCGGCQWQHVSIEGQRAAKQRIVESALRDFVGQGLEVLPILTPVPDLHWRRRARLHWQRRDHLSHAVLGLFAPRSKTLEPVAACPQLVPALDQLLPILQDRLSPGLFQEGEVDVVAGHSGSVHLAVRGPCDRSAASELVGQANIAGVVLPDEVLGEPDIELEPSVRARAEQFAQASDQGNQALCRVVADACQARSDMRVLELFAGAGNLTRVLARQGAQVEAVERLDGLLAGAEAHYAGFDLRPVLSSPEEIADWAAFCRSANRRYPAAVHVDTGMRRLGVPAGDFKQMAVGAGPLDDFELAVIMSHLACADTPKNTKNAEQRKLFEELRALVPNAPASLANSGGTFLGDDYLFDLVRPGISLYGGRAFEGGPNPMQPVVRLSARILQVQEADIGDTVGYGASHTVTRKSRIATIACGYADGFLRALGGDASRPGPVGFIAEHEVRIVGRVSMDLITLDVTDVPSHLAAGATGSKSSTTV